ncbi:MAG: TraR/DksA family transcriptional regulator [Myxococcaceae bacterium]|nr:TraR/DksA family transcriptional regulator [Myxococcaceae bacterium]
MNVGRSARPSDKLLEAKALFLKSVEELARDPEQLVAAVGTGLDDVFDQLLRQACEEAGADLDAFAAALERDDALRGEIQQKLAELFNSSTVQRARAAAVKRDLQRHLHVLRFVLSGHEPPAWVWDSMDDDEAMRLREYREEGGDEDPALLSRVERALAKVDSGDEHAFGRCEGCGREIPLERLQLMPWAERCTSCQRQLEVSGSDRTDSSDRRVDLWMFFEAGKAVPPAQQFRPGRVTANAGAPGS